MTDKKTVLVVDDDRDMVATLCDILELHGWNTLRGYDGEEAVSIARAHDVDWILMDVRMPRLTGVDAWQAIRRFRPTARTVLMTAYASQELMVQAEREGVSRVIRKPFDLPVLLELLR